MAGSMYAFAYPHDKWACGPECKRLGNKQTLQGRLAGSEISHTIAFGTASPFAFVFVWVSEHIPSADRSEGSHTRVYCEINFVFSRFLFFSPNGPWEAGNARKTLLAGLGTFLDIESFIPRTFMF